MDLDAVPAEIDQRHRAGGSNAGHGRGQAQDGKNKRTCGSHFHANTSWNKIESWMLYEDYIRRNKLTVSLAGNLCYLIKTQGAQFVKIDNSVMYAFVVPVEERGA